jgi:hypothetical protein
VKNVTIRLSNNLARRARAVAFQENKSLSRFVADLLEQRCKTKNVDKISLLRAFFEGPGYPGISKAWRGREALYEDT